jgi:hypothetical protein
MLHNQQRQKKKKTLIEKIMNEIKQQIMMFQQINESKKIRELPQVNKHRMIILKQKEIKKQLLL